VILLQQTVLPIHVQSCAVKGSAEFKTLPIVVLTSSREEQDVVRSYDLGVNAYVVNRSTFTSSLRR
jgi:DNA-binding NarL/FixJ family response regulator